MSAVRDAHIALGFPDPRSQMSMCRLERIQTGIKRVAATRRKPGRVRLPLTPAILHELRSFWMEKPEDGNRTLLWAIAAICYFGFFRLGELLSSQDKPSRLPPQWGEVAFNHGTAPTIVRVHLKFAKCDQFGQGADVFIGQSGNAICPIAACLSYVAVRGDQPGPFFVKRDGRPMLKPDFVSELRRALTARGFDSLSFAGHSFRIGAATAAAAAGIEDSTQCCREILFLFNRPFRDISRNEDLIAIFISRYIINIYYQFIISYSLLWWLIMATKVSAKPALVATKDEFVCVDRKVYKSSVWQYFGWHKKAIGFCWVVSNICYGWVS